MKQKKLDKEPDIRLIFDSNINHKELTFPYICKFVRSTFGFTQPQMAKKLGVSLCAYKFWEYGKREPSSKAAANLSIMYLQALCYIKKTSDKDIKLLLDWLLAKEDKLSASETEDFPDVVCA